VPEGDGYYLPDDLTDRTVKWLHAVRAQDAQTPWCVYYSTGCSHAPHQVPVEWSEKYRGTFDQGWDQLREETFERQKTLGVIPEDAVLTPRPQAMPAWDSLSDSEKKLYARQMEVYAGYSENADHNVGRLLDAIQQMGELENTLIIWIWGDNGSSMEGTITGSFNEMTMPNGIALTPEQQLSLIDQYGGLDAWGTDATAPHYAAAWAWAGNTPFHWRKQVASHLGGTRNGMVAAWPERIKDPGGQCSQFTHAIDVGPTILEAAGIPDAKFVDGIEQEPMHGTSFAYTFDDPTAAERHTQQYSRSTATERSTRTGGGPAPGSTGSRGTPRRQPSAGSRPANTTPRRTPGSSTTCLTISRRQTTSPRTTRTSSRSSKHCSWRRPRNTRCCRCWVGWPSSSGSCRRCRRTPRRRFTATSRTSRAE
jgi:arylsulfatase A-like enzyme